MAVEVEIKAFLTKEQYEKLRAFFREQSDIDTEDHQETHYYSAPVDLRIQRSDHGAKLIVKNGDVHDTIRKEIEVNCNRDDFEHLQQALAALGYNVKVKWIRTRHTYAWQGITATLDDTKGNGYLLELEILTTPERSHEALAFLREKLRDLGVQETPLEEMKKKFKHYAENWRQLI